MLYIIKYVCIKIYNFEISRHILRDLGSFEPIFFPHFFCGKYDEFVWNVTFFNFLVQQKIKLSEKLIFSYFLCEK